MTENEKHAADALADAMLDESATGHDDDERLRRELATTSAGVLITPRDLGDGRVEIVPGYVVQSQPLLRYSDIDGYDRNGASDGFNVYSDADGGL